MLGLAGPHGDPRKAEDGPDDDRKADGPARPPRREPAGKGDLPAEGVRRLGVTVGNRTAPLKRRRRPPPAACAWRRGHIRKRSPPPPRDQCP